MSQQVQELIEKIKSEGIEAGQKQADDIIKEAQNKAASVIKDSKNQAQQLVLQSQEEIKKMKEAANKALQQASRDALLSLRKEIENTLKKLVYREVGASLSGQPLAEILKTVIQQTLSAAKEGPDIQFVLSPRDLDQLKNGFLTELQKELKNPIHFQSSGDISGGFTVSFDSGKSSFDFTDESLAAYLGIFLNAQVAAIVKEAV